MDRTFLLQILSDGRQLFNRIGGNKDFAVLFQKCQCSAACLLQCTVLGQHIADPVEISGLIIRLGQRQDVDVFLMILIQGIGTFVHLA